jgi:hypothetical protein
MTQQKTVTPVETGIQDIYVLDSCSKHDWIPASAGMTKQEDFRVFAMLLKFLRLQPAIFYPKNLRLSASPGKGS